jgi:CMP-N,N'-diacetyllegionaminic acid synthase
MKHEDTYAIAIIPAKTDSTRLPKKNLQVIDGKTLLEHSLDYAKNSEYIKQIVVSTESKEVREICKKYDNILVYSRPKHLLKDAEVADVYVDVFQNQFRKHNEWKIPSRATHMVALQPDNPDRNHKIDKVIDYFIDNTYDDLVTVGKDGTRNGASRITKAQYVKDGSMSRRMGTYLDDCTNIHSEEDLKQAERNIQNNE